MVNNILIGVYKSGKLSCWLWARVMNFLDDLANTVFTFKWFKGVKWNVGLWQYYCLAHWAGQDISCGVAPTVLPEWSLPTSGQSVRRLQSLSASQGALNVWWWMEHVEWPSLHKLISQETFHCDCKASAAGSPRQSLPLQHCVREHTRLSCLETDIGNLKERIRNAHLTCTSVISLWS